MQSSATRSRTSITKSLPASFNLSIFTLSSESYNKIHCFITMKQFIAFVRKEFFHIFRDRRTMLILLGMPVVQIILFGFAITTEVRNVRVAVLDPSNDAVT